MNYIYLCVNYDSSLVLNETLVEWKEKCNKVALFVVDNYINETEKNKVEIICDKHGATFFSRANLGYGAALNFGLSKILAEYSDVSNKKNTYVFFGNCDVKPVNEIKIDIPPNKIPMLNVYKKGVNCNPYMNSAQVLFIFLLCLAGKKKSKTLFLLWRIFYNFARFFPARVIAVHGSLFCLSIEDLKVIHPIFDERVFLYYEELYFMKEINKLRKAIEKTELTFTHIGSVSTSSHIKDDRHKFYLNLFSSVKAFCDKYDK